MSLKKKKKNIKEILKQIFKSNLKQKKYFMPFLNQFTNNDKGFEIAKTLTLAVIILNLYLMVLILIKMLSI